MKFIFRFFILISFFIIATISCDNNKCDTVCKSWEACMKQDTSPETYECELKKNKCVSRHDCKSRQFCDEKKHTCEWICTLPCHSWEVCTENDTCEARKGYCLDNNNCPSNKECNNNTHRCNYKCEPRCANWEICTENKRCIPDSEHCDEYTDCGKNKICGVDDVCELICNPSCSLNFEICSENGCKNIDGFCSVKEGCSNGKKCIDGHCKEESGCTPRCEENYKTCINNKCTLIDGYCNSNEDCKISEICTPVFEDSNICKPICENNQIYVNGKCGIISHDCNNNNDCNPDHECIDNKCKKKCTECENWQECSNNGCILKENSCNINTDCTNGKICENHKCIATCNPTCESWEYCNDSRNCILNEDRCTNDTQCENKKCNLENHRCEFRCEPTCNSWEVCNESNCILKDGFCIDNSRCNCDLNTHTCIDDECNDANDCILEWINRSCNLNTHKCVVDPGTCDPICEAWEECTEQGECKKKNGYCINNDECEANKYCSNKHICEPKEFLCTNNTDCLEGQRCSRDYKCIPIINSCDNDNDCPSNQRCNQQTKECTVTCDEICEMWEHCTDDGTHCILNDGECDTTDNECETDQRCTEHICENVCEPACEEWQECNSEKVCITKESNCFNDSNCENGQSCENHTCIYNCEPACEEWQECDSNHICKLKDDYCDESSNCGTRYGFSASCNLNTHFCEPDPSNNCDPTCKPWQKCENGECKKLDNRCEKQNDCRGNKYCDLILHVCKEEESNNCVPFCKRNEHCVNSECEIIPGSCDNENPCGDGKICDINKNICVEKVCHPNCNPWEYCNNQRCETKEDRCSEDSDCPGGTCNQSSHICDFPNCNCKEWEDCNNGICSISENRCINNSNCIVGDRSCDLNLHTCIEDDCNPNCKEWQYCDANNNCKKRDDKCSKKSDCDSGQACINYECVDVPNGCPANICQEWQTCTDGLCKAREGKCDGNINCDSGSCVDHICQPTCNPSCEFWQECTFEGCNLKTDFCETGTCTEEGSTCNLGTHKCEKCLDCKGWEYCKDDVCTNRLGRCNNKQDCLDKEECDENHFCQSICPTSCEPWLKCENAICVKDNTKCESECPGPNYECNPDTHECEINNNSCRDKCDETWQTCSDNGKCEKRDGFCREHTDCDIEIEECNFNSHRCEKKGTCNPKCFDWETCIQKQCVAKDGKCKSKNDCEDGKKCNLTTHECIDEDNNDCNPACKDWEDCKVFSEDGESISICFLKEDRCNARTYCGEYSLCNSNTYNCEYITEASCGENQVSLNTCSLIYGTCTTENDCSKSEICLDGSCVYKECSTYRDCSSICEDVCLHFSTADITKIKNLNKKNILEVFPYEEQIEGFVTAIKAEGDRKGFYISEKVINIPKGKFIKQGDNFQNVEAKDCVTHNDCITEEHGQVVCIKNKCTLMRGLQNLLYGSIFVSTQNISVPIGAKVKIKGNYINHYGAREFRAKYDVTAACDADCLENKKIFDILDIKVANILIGTDNKADGFENMLINAVGEIPYTVIDNAQKSNGYRVTVKDALNSKFVISTDMTQVGLPSCVENTEDTCESICDEGAIECSDGKYIRTCVKDNEQDCWLWQETECEGNEICIDGICTSGECHDECEEGDIECSEDERYIKTCIKNDQNCLTWKKVACTNSKVCKVRGLSKGVGQCTSNLCSNVTCHKYCEDGFELDQINPNLLTDKKDSDYDTIIDSKDNCKNIPNPGQGDIDNDGIGDACEIGDIDGDGINDGSDNCVGVSNSNQAVTIRCDSYPSGATGPSSVTIFNNGSATCSCTWNNPSDHQGEDCPSTIKYANGAVGDACKDDPNDQDGVVFQDNCSGILNGDQSDIDGDEIGDVCDGDIDGDGIPNAEDNAPYLYNALLCIVEEEGECKCKTNNSPVFEIEKRCTQNSSCNIPKLDEKGKGKCEYHETALRSLKGILKYDNMVVQNDCTGANSCESGTCKSIPNGSGRCCENSSCTTEEKGFYSIIPRSTEDYTKCEIKNCPSQSIPENWDKGL